MENSKWQGVAGEPGRTDYTDRLPVPGGWIYRTRAGAAVGLTFVPAEVNVPGRAASWTAG